MAVMPIGSTTRLGLTTYSAGTDPFLDRSTYNNDMAALDADVAIDMQGTLAGLPAPGVRGRYYWVTDAPGYLLRDTGVAWYQLPIHGPARTRVYRLAAWATTSGPTAMLFDQVTYDRAFAHYGAGFGYSSSTGLFTVPVAGVYSVKAKLEAVSTAAGQFVQASIVKNGGLQAQGTVLISPGSGNVMHSLVTDDVLCAVGDALAIGQIASAGGLVGEIGSADAYACFNFVGQS